MAVKGMAKVLSNFRKEVADMELGSRKGLQEVGRLMKPIVIAVTPMDENKLRKKFFFRTKVKKSSVTLNFGNSSFYAPFVHEMPKTNNWTTPGAGPKFITGPFNKKRRLIQRTVRKAMKR